VSLTYKLATGLPISYNIVPSSIRSRLLKKGQLDTNLTNHLSGETARRSVEQAFSASGFPLREREPPKFLITHDIDTAKGLEKALPMKAVEDKLDLRSTWFLSSGDYLTSKDTAKDLGSNATIGSHDVKHDGKLIHIHNRKRLVDRLKESRDKLEHVFERDVQCFRSPLLQFSSVLINALAEAGYRYDFSLPCWEPSHPITMSGFGVELTKPLQIGEILETPLSLFQDHQVLYVLGLSPREAIRFWVEQARIIKSYDGDIVLLVHPDYEFSSDLDSYRELLLALKNISDRSFHVDPE
jgi:peptidoglycan/xylan/chitin deacetylase (PgdA/CDA1 family)